ncbi:hypothetical protein C8F01DRAFT_1371431 [Mycena amicta]|nr:hypothetical protein C8F01DRAFT_1371431 [Mycena amicta]
MSGRLGGSRFLAVVALLWCYWINPSFGTLVQTHRYPSRPLEKRDALSNSGLTSASWIWTSEATVGNVAFQKTFNPPAGKRPAAATFYITAVDQFTLWVNGHPIGQADDWQSVQYLSAELNVSTNTLSVLAVNQNKQNGPKPALLAAIQIQYTDNSTDLVVSDANWLVSASIPSDFPSSSSSSFQSATVVETFGSGSLSSSITVPDPPPMPTYTPTVIWSTANAHLDAPAGTSGFRKTFAADSDATSAIVFAACDNTFTLYLNGVYIGAPPNLSAVPNYHRLQEFSSLSIRAGASNTITIFGTNIPKASETTGGGASLAATIVVDGSNQVINTDTTWLSGPFTTVSSFLALPDSALSTTFGYGVSSLQPGVGFVTGISNGLAAADVPSGPFAAGTPGSSAVPDGNGQGQGTSSGSGSNSQETGEPTGSSGKNKTSIGLIIGIVIAVLVAIGIGLGFVWYCIRARRRQRLSSSTFSDVGSPSNTDLTAATSAQNMVEPYIYRDAYPQSQTNELGSSTVGLSRSSARLPSILMSSKLEREHISPVAPLSPNQANSTAQSGSGNRTLSASVDGTDAYSMMTSAPPPSYSE